MGWSSPQGCLTCSLLTLTAYKVTDHHSRDWSNHHSSKISPCSRMSFLSFIPVLRSAVCPEVSFISPCIQLPTIFPETHSRLKPRCLRNSLQSYHLKSPPGDVTRSIRFSSVWFRRLLNTSTKCCCIFVSLRLYSRLIWSEPPDRASCDVFANYC